MISSLQTISWSLGSQKYFGDNLQDFNQSCSSNQSDSDTQHHKKISFQALVDLQSYKSA